MNKLRTAIRRAFSFSTDSSLNHSSEDDGDLRRSRTKSVSTYADNNNDPQSAHNMVFNSFYNDLLIFDAQDGIRCLKVVDDSRIAVGLETGKVVVWNVLLQQRLHLLHNHKRPIKLLEVVKCSSTNVRLISAGEDELITIWELDTGEMIKCFRLKEDPNIRFIHHVRSSDDPNRITLLSGQSKLVIVQVTITNLTFDRKDVIINSKTVGRTNAESDIIELLESSEHVICLSTRNVDVYQKQWDANGSLELRKRVDNALEPASDGPLYTCAVLLPDDQFAVGTVMGGVYICKLKRTREPVFLPANACSSSIKHLRAIHRKWLAVICDLRVHIVAISGSDAGYQMIFKVPLLAVAQPRSNILVTLVKESSKLHVWDLSDILSSKRTENSHSLRDISYLLAHDGVIRGVDVMAHSLVTYGADHLVIVWKNKDEEILRLFAEAQARDSMFTEDDEN